MIDRREFQEKVLAMASAPNDPGVVSEYFETLYHFAGVIAKSYKVNDLEDCIQDLIEYSIVKELHTRIDPQKSAFSYYYKALGNHIWYLYQKKLKNRSIPCDMNDNALFSDKGLGEEFMLEQLSWTLEDYEGDSFEEVLENMETVEVSSKSKRGRPRKKNPEMKAKHWEYLFSLLAKKKTMTEAALIKQLPDEKRNSLKDPSKSVKYYMRAIANREGVHLSISDDGSHVVYMIVGG